MNLYGGIFKFFCETFGEAANPELSRMVNGLPGNGDHAKNGGGIYKHGFGSIL